MISFSTSKADSKELHLIAKRAQKLLPHWGRTKQDWWMDVTACHANGTPLRIAALKAADDFNFLHDVTGIARHLNRETGQLENHFRPRFASKEQEAA